MDAVDVIAHSTGGLVARTYIQSAAYGGDRRCAARSPRGRGDRRRAALRLDDSLVRYLVRPPLALARLTASSGGQLLYHFRRPWSDGSTALLLEPLELLERLAALVPTTPSNYPW
jgi:hypothetical protein